MTKVTYRRKGFRELQSVTIMAWAIATGRQAWWDNHKAERQTQKGAERGKRKRRIVNAVGSKPTHNSTQGHPS